MEFIENKTFDEIEVGDSASVVRTLSQEDIELFAVMSGDVNPAHLDEEYAKSDMFQKIIAHGMWGGSLVSTVLGTKLPGPGTIYLGQTFKFRRPVGIGDTITVTAIVADKDEESKKVVFDCTCTNQDGKAVIEGSATVLAPTEKVKRPRPILPEVLLRDTGARFRKIVAMTENLDPVRMAIVHPVAGPTLQGADEAAKAGLIVPVLIGPRARIEAAAEEEGLDISPYELIDTDHSHAAAAKAVAMARALDVGAIMQSTKYALELMQAAVTRYSGIRTARRMSHIDVMDVPGYDRLLLITDSFVNADPSFDDKRDIVQNAIDLARILGVTVPKVALLSAFIRVDFRVRSTMEAAALCKMADRGQIKGAVIDGPLTYDTAVSAESASKKGLITPVAGEADILVAPDLEAGALLTKQLEFQADSMNASVVMGGRVPIVFTSITDDVFERMTSCALAVLAAKHKAENPDLTTDEH